MPLAFTISLLSWGTLEFPKGYAKPAPRSRRWTTSSGAPTGWSRLWAPPPTAPQLLWHHLPDRQPDHRHDGEHLTLHLVPGR